jgi:lysophospholipase L1-like esterase
MGSETKTRADYDEKLVILISVGINDSYIHNKNSEPETSPEQFRKNLEMISSIARDYKCCVIFVGSNPVDKRVDPVPWRTEIRYTLENVKKYNQILADFCKEQNIEFIDIMPEWLKEDYSKLLDDGLHPNSEGHERIFQSVRKALEKKGLI